jgi:hypothetical protein
VTYVSLFISIHGNRDVHCSKSTKVNTAIQTNKAKMQRKEINYGKYIIYTDIDTVWLKGPRLYLKGGFDVWAPLYHWYHYCTGFVALSATSAVECFLIEWENMLHIIPLL